MTVAEAAARLGIAPRTVRAQIATGRLAATKRGRDWDLTPATVERYRRDTLGKPGPKGGKP